MAEISADLRAAFLAHADDPGHFESVIVTLRSSADATQLESAGMLIEHRLRNRPIVSGRLTSQAFDSVAQLADVVRIEPDSEMHAL